ncbi:peptidoglycan bridge formation protein FemAB [Alkalispirochaeta sphaeroplastigenens]|uniref:Peptidoglycan bridge formation protein FemAB n=1 Tax=Alkalispirochaeta sphaeroplastigenens TaxID=1187066 RepID=A0A2S4JS58_9SPIO|nr:peptidoglycan bridge formation glycyltransferase FemA/FemB family protein [Alkalispirochaeta sphaeroplastigenens]POR02293.1 peptidoglycan bridge formation protein FemAB [Alkalispirochaeta sphaeroplastigenens]
MVTDLRSKSPDELFSTPIVQQTAFWSSLKSSLGVRSLALDFRVGGWDGVATDVLVVLQRVDRFSSIAYVPYGPEVEPSESSQGAFLEELSECLREVLPSDCFCLRYDLCWESFWAKDPDYYDDQGHWLGPPQVKMQELRFNYNTVRWNLKKAPSNILPSNTVYLDLRPRREQILAQMKPKTRYNIGLSRRKGVEVRCLGLEFLDTWYRLYAETARRNGLFLHDIEYFRAVLLARVRAEAAAGQDARVLLLVAESQGVPLAAMFLVLSGNRASYLYGASAGDHRKVMATYALQWEAMNIARDRGCCQYDMFGVAPRPDPDHPMHGLYRFKTGFGGTLYHSLGCWDYPLDQERYARFVSQEFHQQGFHLR